MSLPLMVRPGTLLPLGNNEERPDYAFAEDVTLHLFELADGATAQVAVPTVTGDSAFTANAQRVGDRIIVSTTGEGSWCVLLRGVASVSEVAGGTARAHALGTLVTPTAGEGRLEVAL